MARLELAKTWHRHRCRRRLRWLWHQDPNAEPFPALSRKGDMPRSFLVPLGARMPDSSVPPSEWTAPGTAQSRTGPRRATADRVDRADARRLAGQEDHRTGLFRHTGADRERQLRADFLEAARREMGLRGRAAPASPPLTPARRTRTATRRAPAARPAGNPTAPPTPPGHPRPQPGQSPRPPRALPP